ncbi:glycoside hydrolase [Coraliomargarita sinensis]|uniref:Glycoside hydrolase n=1 Tax=Coraliomargarita sinensis TaxID=2174842 RepID=A0A317ZJL4_9BACT|nr:glycosyl hydrolase [Coraliomargarita sinensis]PXA04403.1 glycoside hydrolase [Coraliomargarita sinensis]
MTTRSPHSAFWSIFTAAVLTAGCAQAGQERTTHFIEPVRAYLSASLEPMMSLEEGWRNPPRIARTRVYWWWLNGNVTKKAITDDLEALKDKGYGGALLFDAGGDTQRGGKPVPAGPLFASPEWTKLFKHAVEQAARLDLELGLNIQSGWNLGGPLVPLEHASKKLTYAETTLQGGRDIAVKLPQPEAKEGYYRDVAVVAVPLKVHDATETKASLAASSTQNPSHQAARVADGDLNTFWVSQGITPGGGPSPQAPQWLELRFEEATPVDRVQITARPGYGPKQGRIEISTGQGWKPVRENLAFQQKTSEITFDAVDAKALRVVFTGADDPRHPDAPRNVQVAELALFQGDQPVFSGGGTKTSSTQLSQFKKKAYYEYPGGFTAAPAWHLLEPGGGSAACAPAEVVDLSEHLSGDGQLTWSAPEGTWQIIRLGYTYSGSHVSTSSGEWVGRCIDYLDAGAFDFYWDEVVEPLLAEVKPHLGKTLNFLHDDSWELGPINWTPKLPEAFAERRGYDITPWLPVLAGHIVESPEASTRFLNDFRATLADLIHENKYVQFSRRAHQHGLGIHPESGGPHAGPFDAMRNLGVSDIPMGEFWNRNNRHRVKDSQRFFVKQTSSVAHIYGRRLSMAEAFTTIGPHWERSPRMLKHDFDRAVCEGHNLTVWHTYDSSPEEMGLPGQAYFAGTHGNNRVTWWPMINGFIDYMNRVQFMMQQGLSVSDVLYFKGENIPGFVRLKRDDPAGVLPGYDYDVIDKLSLLHRLAVAPDGALALPHGVRYRVLALPAHDTYDLPALEKIAELVEAGATVCGPRPEKRYGLIGDAAADQRFAELVEHLWGSGQISTLPTREILEQKQIEPDFTWEEREVQTSKDHFLTVDYFHRTTTDADLYYVVNRLNVPRRITASFRQKGRQPELWDPVSARITPNPAYKRAGERTELELALPPEASVLVVFRKPEGTHTPRSVNIPEVSELLTLSKPWEVSFQSPWGPQSPVTFDALTCWTRHPNEKVKFYSGIADYKTSFDFDERLPSGPDRQILLDLGEVREVARVLLNGRDLGVVWSTPARIDLAPALKTGTNQLTVQVANNWPNRMIGDQHLPEDQRYTRSNFQKFRKNSPLQASGLIGPVKLLRVNTE